MSVAKNYRDITAFDWFCLAGAILGIVFWRLTNDPLTAVIVITVTDTIAFAPTYRKGYLRPHEETASLFVLSGFKYFVSLFALSTFNLTTSLFPAALVASNFAFVIVLWVRRRQLAKQREGDTIASNDQEEL